MTVVSHVCQCDKEDKRSHKTVLSVSNVTFHWSFLNDIMAVKGLMERKLELLFNCAQCIKMCPCSAVLNTLCCEKGYKRSLWRRQNISTVCYDDDDVELHVL